MAKKYMMKKNLKPIENLIPGETYSEGDFPAAYMHMFVEVKEEEKPKSTRRQKKEEQTPVEENKKPEETEEPDITY